ncbi:D-alanyl-D-alanine dipeptidase [Neosynechococcus sphagnicola sy1]|uniref:D-alanyl-D-alanine dipeptidase n=1 Tax=Neosynechococcus sphagnicola sy1 TaxID=1497020 RepID=A0A098TK65_9CYAN|nr:M15 family metallopeptidase [Neosynechococcus sphagnicola]KGF72666.1 D-alanyl-D-alanine dipeptidase [Neosynechococcus sphagnicola sy1]
MKPYQKVPIEECGEPMIAILPDLFAVVSPHPYQVLGAPYGEQSPYFLRQRVVTQLLAAQEALQQDYPGWRLQIFDAYRPVAVQQFMVDQTLADLARSQGLTVAALTPDQQQTLREQVYTFWAPPSLDPTMPPPHSTGAALDLTLVDGTGQVVDMGSPIDECSPRSYPDYFQISDRPLERQYHHHRQLLARVMIAAGFQRHPQEWWHFSWGDQLWAWLSQQSGTPVTSAHYGRYELIHGN